MLPSKPRSAGSFDMVKSVIHEQGPRGSETVLGDDPEKSAGVRLSDSEQVRIISFLEQIRKRSLRKSSIKVV